MRLRTSIAGIVLLGLIVAGAWWVAAPYAGFSRPVFVDLPRGTGTRAIAERLAEAGVIRSPWQLLAVRALRPSATLKAGEYRFDKLAAPWEVFDRLARGDIFYISLVVPEGNNIFDIAAEVERQGVMPGIEFLAAVRDTSLIRDLDPRAPSLEGYLFPDTYHIPRKIAAEQLARQMTERFRKAWQQLGSPKADVHDVVTQASLVEKEAKVREERPLIASVFANRLKAGMPLQCDPTTIYAALLEDRYRGTIHRSDLDRKHLYNTYQYPGLPPGPIANPGLDSLRAALRPAATEYLYFVARPDGSGAHQFSTGLAEHERAVKQYRRGLRAAQQTNGTDGLARRARAGGNRAGGGRPASNPARAN